MQGVSSRAPSEVGTRDPLVPMTLPSPLIQLLRRLLLSCPPHICLPFTICSELGHHSFHLTLCKPQAPFQLPWFTGRDTQAKAQ